MENKILSNSHWKDQLICVRVQEYNSLEPILEYNQDQVFWTIKGSNDFLGHHENNRGITLIHFGSQREIRQNATWFVKIWIFGK